MEFNKEELSVLKQSLRMSMEVLEKENKEIEARIATIRMSDGNNDELELLERKLKREERLYSKMHKLRWSIKREFDSKNFKQLEKELFGEE